MDSRHLKKPLMQFDKTAEGHACVHTHACDTFPTTEHVYPLTPVQLLYKLSPECFAPDLTWVLHQAIFVCAPSDLNFKKRVQTFHSQTEFFFSLCEVSGERKKKSKPVWEVQPSENRGLYAVIDFEVGRLDPVLVNSPYWRHEPPVASVIFIFQKWMPTNAWLEKASFSHLLGPFYSTNKKLGYFSKEMQCLNSHN